MIHEMMICLILNFFFLFFSLEILVYPSFLTIFENLFFFFLNKFETHISVCLFVKMNFLYKKIPFEPYFVHLLIFFSNLVVKVLFQLSLVKFSDIFLWLLRGQGSSLSPLVLI